MCNGFLVVKNMEKDEKFMQEALKEAHKSFDLDEVPVGVVIGKDGKIIARGHNTRESKQDPTAHAEINAIKKASKKLKSWRLIGCKMYVTLEPCSMCAGAIMWSRIDEVIYGAKDPKGGALGSSYNLFEQKGINHFPKIVSGIKENEASELLKKFFKSKRK